MILRGGPPKKNLFILRFTCLPLDNELYMPTPSPDFTPMDRKEKGTTHEFSDTANMFVSKPLRERAN
jgi:hypothetical protein